ncbi:MAG: bifunctional precorrin-2 dehydrogenase/sirohydrochlorin ferrochelatase [Aquificaceae bacterium]
MPYFPVFLDLKGKEVVVAGGGPVAERKVKKLLPFEPNIKVIAPRVTDGIKELNRKEKIRLILRRVRLSDIKGAFLVIAALDDLKLQKRLYEYCKKKGILCNTVDNIEYCSFIFPALVVKDDVVIGISTSGKVPALSRALREYIERSLPKNIEEIAFRLDRLRKSLPKGKERQEKLKDLALRMVFTSLPQQDI